MIRNTRDEDLTPIDQDTHDEGGVGVANLASQFQDWRLSEILLVSNSCNNFTFGDGETE